MRRHNPLTAQREDSGRPRKHFGFRTALALTAGLALLGLAACGKSATNTASTGGTAASSLPASSGPTLSSASLQAALNAGYKGDFQTPTATGPKAVRGKNVWVVSCGQVYPLCVVESSQTVAAGQVLGWHMTLVDGKAQASVATTAIDQAVAAKANGIVVYGFDCPGIKSALLNAKSAHIPVVSAEGIDCNQAPYNSGPPLYTASTNLMGSTSGGAFPTLLGTEDAKYLAAALHGKGTIVYLGETSYATSQYQNQGFATEIKSACPQCKVIDVPWTFAQVGTSASQTWAAALLKYPNASAVSFPYDAMMGLGLQADLKQAGYKGLVAGTQGENLDLVRSGVQTEDTAAPESLLGWGTADTLNRIFAGEPAAGLPNEGGGIILVDKTHNLPASGDLYNVVPFDFVKLYTTMWNG